MRARINKKQDCICLDCGNERKDSLELYDLKIGNTVFTLCDLCANDLFKITLKLTTNLQGKLKSSKDLALISKRRQKNENRFI